LASSPLPLKVTRVAGGAEPGFRKIDPRGVGIGVGAGVGVGVGLGLGDGIGATPMPATATETFVWTASSVLTVIDPG